MRQLKISKSVTVRESASFDRYLQEIGKIEMITPEEEVDLTRKIKCGDQAAFEKLTKANLRFVISVAKQYQGKGLTLPDLINEGNLGLAKAAKRFDETRGFKFISYAVWWIRQSILQAIAENSRIVRLPLNQIGTLGKINKAYSKLEQRLERPPSPDEIAFEMGMSDTKMEKSLKNLNQHVISMDAPTSENDDTTFQDTYAPDQPSADEPMMQESLKKEIDRSLAILTDRERDVVKLYYGIGLAHGYTLEEIGEKFDLTRERVRQIKEKAIRRLKPTSRSKNLKTYI